MGRSVVADHLVITGLADAWLMMLHVSLSLSRARASPRCCSWMGKQQHAAVWSSLWNGLELKYTDDTNYSFQRTTKHSHCLPSSLTGVYVSTDHSYLCHNRKITSLHPSALGFVTSVLVIAKTNINFTIDHCTFEPQVLNLSLFSRWVILLMADTDVIKNERCCF